MTKIEVEFSNELQKVHSQALPIMAARIKKIRQICTDIKKLEEVLKESAIPVFSMLMECEIIKSNVYLHSYFQREEDCDGSPLSFGRFGEIFLERKCLTWNKRLIYKTYVCKVDLYKNEDVDYSDSSEYNPGFSRPRGMWGAWFECDSFDEEEFSRNLAECSSDIKLEVSRFLPKFYEEIILKVSQNKEDNIMDLVHSELVAHSINLLPF